MLQIVSAFSEINGVKVPYTFAPRRAGDLATFWADASLAEREMGWKARRTLDGMMRDIWRWQQRNPYGYRRVYEKNKQ
ncbi:hypothetical protein [Halomonas saccharevitans]|uniref:hypothetical protein n=1 Tax=Halomonas saccharevitans TaxID=416872 RepID=UPI000A3E64F3|nr:hypothetical protein [Halomonas saccharevitans]